MTTLLLPTDQTMVCECPCRKWSLHIVFQAPGQFYAALTHRQVACCHNVCLNTLPMCQGAALRQEEPRIKLYKGPQAGVPQGSKRCKRWWAPKDGRRCDAEHKPLDDFNKEARATLGRRAVCKKCETQDREVCRRPA